MKFLCARQCWHDAFMTDTAAPDFATQAAGVGVQFTSRGADNRILDHVERGYIQHAIAELKQRDYTAYCWGMIAYAPAGTATVSEYAALAGELRAGFWAAVKTEALKKERYKPDFEGPLMRVIRLAITESSIMDAQQGPGPGYRQAEIAAALGLPLDAYRSRWARRYRAFIAHCLDTYPARALPAVAAVVAKFEVAA